MKIDYKKICANLLKGLPKRTKGVMERRFGLKKGEGETLEAIGNDFGITRERVRQIENEGFSKIGAKLADYKNVFQYFNDVLASFGDLKREDVLLNVLGKENFQSQAAFLLNLDKGFIRFSEDKDFHSFWARRKEAVDLAKKVIDISISKFEAEKKPLGLDTLFAALKSQISNIVKKPTKDTLVSYIEISKKIQKNPEGQLGLRNWVEINPRGIKDRAFLVFKKESKPLHFTQVATLIEQLPFFPKRKIQVAAVHNELIRDSRFVLVGRGLYALKDWGYQPGVVKDVIIDVLNRSQKPLAREEIVKKVLEQRFVKANTVALNLQNKNYFLRDSDGRYTIKEG